MTASTVAPMSTDARTTVIENSVKKLLNCLSPPAGAYFTGSAAWYASSTALRLFTAYRPAMLAISASRWKLVRIITATIVTGTVNIALVLSILFVLGTAETFADSASSTLIPGLVARADLGIANARMQGAFLLTNQLLAPPIGAFLFAAGMALPFADNAFDGATMGFSLRNVVDALIFGAMLTILVVFASAAAVLLDRISRRLLLGLGSFLAAAALVPNGLGLLREAIPSGRDRPSAFGMYTRLLGFAR